jgi:Fe-S cluster assembly iron-binding protein IscA
MAVEVTPEAVEVLRRSLQLANIPADSGGGVRLRSVRGLGGGTRIEIELAEALGDGETLIENDGVRIFVDPSVTALFPDAIVAVEPQHEKIVVLPAT